MARLTKTPTPTSTYQRPLQQRGPAAVGYTPGPDKKKKSLMSVLGQLVSVASQFTPTKAGTTKNISPEMKGKLGLEVGKINALEPVAKSASKLQIGTDNAFKELNKDITKSLSNKAKNPTAALTTTKPNTNFFAKENWSSISKATGQMADILSGGSKYGAFSKGLASLAIIGKKENNKSLNINTKNEEDE